MFQLEKELDQVILQGRIEKPFQFNLSLSHDTLCQRVRPFDHQKHEE